MDDTLFSSSSAFEDVVFPYDLDVLSFFDLSRDDGASENAESALLHSLLIIVRLNWMVEILSLRWISQVLFWEMSRMKR
jgi:hypothetical protein